jgi:hypothetical protein
LEKTMTKKWSEVRRKHAPEVEERIRKEVEEAANVPQPDETGKEQAPSEPTAMPEPPTFDQWIQNGIDHFNALARADSERGDLERT